MFVRGLDSRKLLKNVKSHASILALNKMWFDFDFSIREI
jgi:hypothetical protein